MSGASLQAVVLAVSDALKNAKIPHALTGGLATAAWAPQDEVFMTTDVDFGILTPRKDPIAAVLDRVPRSAFDFSSAYVDLGRVCFFKVKVAGVNVDFVLPKHSAFVREAFRRMGQFDVEGVPVPILSPEDVFLYKSIASRVKDVRAMYSLSRRPSFNWKYVERWAKKLGTYGALRELRLIP